MSKFRVKIAGELQDDVFDSRQAAEEYALYLCGCARSGAETLNLSNPGDYPFDEDSFEDPECEIIEEE